MNPRRNLQTRKNRRKRNERWEFRGGVDEWLTREVGRDIRRFIKKHGIEIAEDAAFKCAKDLESGELAVTFGPGTVVWSKPLNPHSWSDE